MSTKYIEIEPNGDIRPYAILFIQPDKKQEKYLLRPIYCPEGICDTVDECVKEFPNCGGIKVLEHGNDKKYVGEHGFPSRFSPEDIQRLKEKESEYRRQIEASALPSPHKESLSYYPNMKFLW